MKRDQIFLFSFDGGNELNGGEIQKPVGFDEVIGQFEPDDLKGMGRSIIIIEIGIGIDEGIFHDGGD
jgi:hypothetical protein